MRHESANRGHRRSGQAFSALASCSTIEVDAVLNGSRAAARDESASTALEYEMIAAIITAITLVSIRTFASQLSQLFDSVAAGM